jgi:membrane protease YdiL (CAAX protease family)
VTGAYSLQNFTYSDVAALALELIPAAVFGLTGERVARVAQRWPRTLRIVLPVLCVVPHLWISISHQMFSWKWAAFYALLPVVIAWLLGDAAEDDPEQRGNWRDALVLLALGLAVDLRWLEGLWPRGLAGLGKLLLVDAALYGFVVMRRLRGTGFDFHFRWSDWKSGLRELALFAPVVIGLGLALGFLHPHANAPRISMVGTWVYIFIFIAVPEELFFRAWVQNLLENRLRYWLDTEAGARAERLARICALLMASVLFGLSHFNKRSAHFNWRYVILATIAGIFYGRAWRENRRVAASSITHACVDWIWSMWF